LLQAFQAENGIVPSTETDSKEGKSKTLKQQSIRDLFGSAAASTVCFCIYIFLF
jgi:hypothetical protein